MGMVDSNETQAVLLAKQCRDAQAFTDLTRALDVLTPDVVHVCTPPHTHVAIVREGLERGCHVLCEKPLTASAMDTKELLALARSRGCLLVPVHQFPFQHGVMELAARLDELGPLVHLEMKLVSAGAERPPRDADEVVTEVLPHCLALTRRMLNASLVDEPWRVMVPQAGEWRIDGSVRVGESGGVVTVSYFVSMSARPPLAEMRVLGSRASALVDLFHGYCVIDAGHFSRSAKATRPFRVAGLSLVAASSNLARRGLRAEPAYPGLNELVRQLYRAIRGQGPSPVLPEEVVDIAVVRDRLVAMGKGGASR